MKSKQSKPANQPDDKAQKPADRPGANRAEQRNQKENQIAQLSAANVEESPKMDPGDTPEASDDALRDDKGKQPGNQVRRGAVDTQYGTHSEKKTTSPSGSADAPDSDNERRQTPDPGSSEQSPGAERDTMSGPRPGGRS